MAIKHAPVHNDKLDDDPWCQKCGEKWPCSAHIAEAVFEIDNYADEDD